MKVQRGQRSIGMRKGTEVLWVKKGQKKKKKETGAWSSIWGRNEWALVGQGWAWKCLENLLGRVLGHGHCQDELGEVRGEKSKRMF